MIRFFVFLAALLFVVPASAQEEQVSEADLARQNQAIAQSVQDQLLGCWSLPPGYEGRRIAVRLAFLGDGSLDGEPVLLPESERLAGKYPELLRSIAHAIRHCVPFAGLEDLGATPDERFDITVNFQS